MSFVSDLSAGGLRFNPVSAGGTQITTDDLSIETESQLSFDWFVDDQSTLFEQSFYQILELDDNPISFHNGKGTGIANGSVSRQIGPGAYQLQIRSAIGNGQLRLEDLLDPMAVIDSSIPSPAEHMDLEVGERHRYTHEIIQYLDAIAEISPRMLPLG